MEEHLISIIVPIYKVEAYLDKCVTSIVEQTYDNLEIILVNDGSPDDSPKICDSWSRRDNRIKVIHKQNGGLSDARNAGLDAASGQYIMFIDGDDYIHEQMAETLYNRLKEDQSDIAICNIAMVDEHANLMNPHGIRPVPNRIMSKIEAFETLSSEKAWHFVIACNKLYSCQIFSKLRFPIGKIHEDEFLIHQIFDLSNTISTTNQALYYYVQRANSIVNSPFSIKRVDACEAYINRSNFFFSKNMKRLAIVSFMDAIGILNKAYCTCDIQLEDNRNHLSELFKRLRKIYINNFLAPFTLKQRIHATLFLFNPRLSSFLYSLYSLKAPSQSTR